MSLLQPGYARVRALLLKLSFVVLLLSLVVGWAAVVNADFYVSPAGSDDNPGTIDRPLKSLERARDAVRAEIAMNGRPQSGLTIWLRGGDYFRSEAFELSEADSGREGQRIAWRSYQDERVRLLGGRLLTSFTPVSDPEMAARLPKPARFHVLQVDLRASGVTKYGELKSRGFGRPAAPAHAELFFAGRPMTLARWPNEGEWAYIKGFPAASEKIDEHNAAMGELTGGFHYEGDRPRSWQGAADIWVHGYWAYDWANSYERVAALDVQRRLIRTAEPYGHYGFRTGQRFYFLNVLEELDQPGEWYLDREAGVLYFWPPADVVLAETLLSVTSEPLIKLAGASYVTIQGLALEASRGNGIEITGGADNQVVGCRLHNLGNWGVTIDGGRRHSIASCDVEDTGDGGVAMTGGDRQTLTPAEHATLNCQFARQGRWSKCYVPAILINGVGNRAAQNHIQHHPHCAILFTGNDHAIEFNDIHHVALETGDVGAIYTGRDYSYRGNRIRGNYIHETGGVGMGSMGVYMDDCISGTEVVGNIFYRVHWAMFIGGGRDHTVENNLFVACDPAVRADGRGLDTAPVWRNMVESVMRGRLAEVPSEIYRQRYPALQTLDRYYGAHGATVEEDNFQGIPPEGNVVRRNVCLGNWLDIAWHAHPEWFDIRDNLVREELAAETLEEGLKLMHSEEAERLGIMPIEFSAIGLQANPERARLGRVQ